MRTSVFFIGAVFPEELDGYFEKNYYKNPDVSSLIYGRKLVSAFEKMLPPGELTVFSLPQVGTYPNTSKKEYVTFETKRADYVPVNYHCHRFIKHLSQAYALKKALRNSFASLRGEDRIKIVVGAAYFPYLLALKPFKKKFKDRLTVTTLVLDLPEYVGISANRLNPISLLKRAYISSSYSLLDKVSDNFVLLSPSMREKNAIANHKSVVCYGLSDQKNLIQCQKKPGKLVFVGKLSPENEIRAMVDAFMLTQDESYTFDIVGDGCEMPYVQEAAKKDSRIIVHGFLSPKNANEIRKQASSIIALRCQDKQSAYAFPSKLIASLGYNVPIISLDLPLYQGTVRECLLLAKTNSPKEIAKLIDDSLQKPEIDVDSRRKFLAEVNNEELAKKILKGF